MSFAVTDLAVLSSQKLLTGNSENLFSPLVYSGTELVHTFSTLPQLEQFDYDNNKTGPERGISVKKQQGYESQKQLKLCSEKVLALSTSAVNSLFFTNPVDKIKFFCLHCTETLIFRNTKIITLYSIQVL